MRDNFTMRVERRAIDRSGVQVCRSWLPLAVLLMGTTLTSASCSMIGGPEIEPEPPRSAQMIGRVKQAFVAAEDISGAAIQVEVADQTIVLTGFVGSTAEKNRAGDVAAKAYPKATIDNRLEVK